MDDTLKELMRWSNYMAITREDDQDTAIIDLSKPDVMPRIEQAIKDMVCLEDDDTAIIRGSCFSSCSMMGSLTVSITQDGQDYDEVMSLTTACLY